jgi:cell volume regulation protein A
MVEPALILLVTGFLVLASILASRVSDRLGVPTLIVFLVIGMLAGSDGPGGIHFDNAQAANLVGTVALAFILFSGGLDTNRRIVQPVLGRGIVLATLGVAMTAVLVGLFAWAVLGLPLLTSLLLGSIISSTDAAAVFSVLRSRGVSLKGNLKPLLELESGSNDPMAIFLTVGITQLVTVAGFQWPQLVPAFVLDMGLGVLVGIGAGRVAALVFNRIGLDYEGLYPVLSMGFVLVTFGAAEFVDGNGFLAVYLCGVMLNGSTFTHKRYMMKFHDGLAWLMQIALFVTLGLLVFPSRLPEIAATGLLVAFFLMFVARPAAVVVGLAGSAFDWRERMLVSWTGLRGAVPIVLATFPLMAGVEHSGAIFDVVFFTVLTSVLIQGTLLMPVARLLKVDEPLAARPSFSLELERFGQAQGETREIEVLPNTAAAGRTIADLDIPPNALILLIGRGDGYVVPRGQTRIQPYDTLLLFGDPSSLRDADAAVLSPRPMVRKREVLDDPLAMLPMTTEGKYLSKQVVVLGYGRVGRRVCQALEARGIPFVVADQNREIVQQLRDRGIPAVTGDAADAMTLAQAHVARASILVIATPDTLKVRQMVEIARQLNPSIEIIIRTHSEMEASFLKQEDAGTVLLGEEELAKSIIRLLLERLRAEPDVVEPPAPPAGSHSSFPLDVAPLPRSGAPSRSS